MLDDDMLNHGLLSQHLQDQNESSPLSEEILRETLKTLLESGKVAIGNARLKTPDYVEFVAWGGELNNQIERAISAISATQSPDKDFAYWLCLRDNIDRVEDI